MFNSVYSEVELLSILNEVGKRLCTLNNIDFQHQETQLQQQILTQQTEIQQHITEKNEYKEQLQQSLELNTSLENELKLSAQEHKIKLMEGLEQLQMENIQLNSSLQVSTINFESKLHKAITDTEARVRDEETSKYVNNIVEKTIQLEHVTEQLRQCIEENEMLHNEIKG